MELKSEDKELLQEIYEEISFLYSLDDDTISDKLYDDFHLFINNISTKKKLNFEEIELLIEVFHVIDYAYTFGSIPDDLYDNFKQFMEEL